MGEYGWNNDVERVRDAVDLVSLIGEHVSLARRGREHVGLCPFHDDSSPSMAVVTHKGNAFYKCHACGAGGDCFTFVKQYHKMDFPAALRFLAERAGIELTERRRSERASGTDHTPDRRGELLLANKRAQELFQRTFTGVAGAAAREAIDRRGITAAMIETFGIGAAPDHWSALADQAQTDGQDLNVYHAAGLLRSRDSGGWYDTFRNRITFPICDELGRPIAFGARAIAPGDEPKYLNSPESPLFDKSATLFGLHLAKRTIIETRQAIVTEGYTDVIACHQAGICNVVATLGTALTRRHVAKLDRLCDSVVLLFDGDQAGLRAADRAIELFFAGRTDVRICVLPDGLDPDELLRSEDGADRFVALISGASDALGYRVERVGNALRADESLSARQNLIEQFLEELTRLGLGATQGVRRSLIVNQLEEHLGVGASIIDRIIARATRAQAGRKARRNEATPVDQETANKQSDATGAAHDQPVEDHDVDDLRRRAERELIALLIYEPRLLEHDIVAVESGVEVKLDAMSLDLEDRSITSIRTALADSLAAGRSGRVQDLLGILDGDTAACTLVTDLYMAVEARHGSDRADDLQQEFADAVQAIRRHAHRTDYQQSVHRYRTRQQPAGQDGPGALAQIIEQRKRQDYVSTAIPRDRR